MLPVWLYSADGRALYCVYVQLPQPTRVTYAGLYFDWNGSRYVEESSGYKSAHGRAYEATQEVPVNEQPPQE
jgi:hypothetical protein